jgi:hypothetical protein
MDSEPVDQSPHAEIDEDRSWCVERGSSLAAMSTDELLQAISSGELPTSARVWCEGLECWTRIRDVPEIAALFGGFEAELARLPEVEIAPPSGFAPRATSLDPSQLDTPSAVPVARPVRSSEGFGARARAGRKKAAGARIADAMGGDDARWIGGGLFVAAAAIAMALFQSRGAMPGRAPAYAEHRLTSVETAAQTAAASLPSAVDRTTLSRIEPGQKRLRGGAGRPNRR